MELTFYKEKNFQETAIGEIPNDWKVTRFGKIITFVKGKKPDEMTQEYKENYLPYLSTEYLRENKITKFVKNLKDVVLVNDGDLILLWDGSNAGEFFLGRQGILSSTMVKIELKRKNYNQRFLFYLLKMKENYLKGQTKGTGIPHVDGAVLSNLIIPQPLLEEQQKIAEILSTVDGTIQKTNEVIAKTERLKKGLMLELLTKGIGHKEFKDTEIGRIPKEWEVVKLENVVEIWDKYRIPVKEQDRKPGPSPYCGANGIIDYVAGYTHDGEFVLLAEDGGFFGPFENSAYIMRGKFWANNHIHILKAIEGISTNEFLMFYLNFVNLIPFLTGSTRPKLTQEDMRKIPLPLPPLQEQRGIAEILSTVDKKIEIERNEKAKLERVKQGLMDLLLTGKIRVKVKGNG